MYLTVRSIKVEKSYYETMILKQKETHVVEKSVGFIKKVIGVNRQSIEFDVFQITIYWESREAFYLWQGSQEHIALHKNAGTRAKEIIESTVMSYDIV